MAAETATILTACAEGVATITLNRPEVRNALDMAMRRDLEAALAALDQDADVRVLRRSRRRRALLRGRRRQVHARQPDDGGGRPVPGRGDQPRHPGPGAVPDAHDRHGGWGRGRRRLQSRAGVRPRGGVGPGALRRDVRPDRPDPRRGRHVLSSAPGRARAGEGAGLHGRHHRRAGGGADRADQPGRSRGRPRARRPTRWRGGSPTARPGSWPRRRRSSTARRASTSSRRSTGRRSRRGR